MEYIEIILIMVAVLQPIAVGLIGWMLVTLNKLNREVGELGTRIGNIIEQITRKSEETDRRFDKKQNKD